MRGLIRLPAGLLSGVILTAAASLPAQRPAPVIHAKFAWFELCPGADAGR